MTSTPLIPRRVQLELYFWDATILLISAARHLVRLMPSRLPIDKRTAILILTWMGWILAGLVSGWVLGVSGA